MMRTPGTPHGDVLEVGDGLLSLRPLLLEPLHLRDQEGRVKLSQAVVRAERVLALGAALGPPAVDDRVGPSGELVVAGEQRAALARGEDLGGLVAERAELADAAGAEAVPPPAVRVGAVLDDRQGVGARDLRDAVHVGHLVAEVHGDHGPGPGGDRGLDRSLWCPRLA
jgi:hypothetical protein